MVSQAIPIMLDGLLLAQDSAKPLIEQLDPPRRAVLIMALLGIALVGITMVACVMIGARWVRRMARFQPRGRRESSAAKEPWRRELAKHLPESNTGDTSIVDQATDDTVVD